MNEDKVVEALAIIESMGALVGGQIGKARDILKEALSPPEPERICGLTMDEWQVVIDGGYQCEFRSYSGHSWTIQKAILAEFDHGRLDPFLSATSEWLRNCRPYRAVGHVQPYFDNDECREYLDGLSDSAIITRHYIDPKAISAPANWGNADTKLHFDDCNSSSSVDDICRWSGNVDKFIVLDNG